MQRNFTEVSYGPEDTQWAKAAPLCSINTPKIPKSKGSRRNIHPAATESRTTRSNLDTIREGFTTSIGASSMMRE